MSRPEAALVEYLRSPRAVRERCAAVLDHALQQARPHAARSSAAIADTIAAASKPDRQPSSWNP